MTDTPDRTLGEIAILVRSKNAGPFWLTLDVFFANDADYQHAAGAGVFTEHRIATLYHVNPDDVTIYRIPHMRVIKSSFPRPVVQGSFDDRDIHGGQQHIPLSNLTIPATAAGPQAAARR